jgi:hypothetical protein
LIRTVLVPAAGVAVGEGVAVAVGDASGVAVGAYRVVEPN